MKQWQENGQISSAEKLPDGLYVYAPGDEIPVRDPSYNGFRIIWQHRKPPSRFGEGTYGIMDTMDGTACPVDGKMYDSKSRYYRTVKESGCEIVGNDGAFGKASPRDLSSMDRKRDIARAFDN